MNRVGAFVIVPLSLVALRITLAMATVVSDHLRSLEEIVHLLEAVEPQAA
jgi:hypothetical protein